jgi:hypothetical protein
MKHAGGRPRKVIDYKIVDRLCAIQCTGEEIASVLGVDYDTLCAGVKRDFKLPLIEYLEQKRLYGKSSLRRAQWKAADSGNPTMLIWLGKQYLGQRDKHDVEHSGTVGVVIQDDITSG